MKLEVAGHGSSVTIQVEGFERPEALDESDANWLSATVIARIGTFTANVTASITTSDLARFANALQSTLDNLSGEAVFDPEEEALRIAITFLPNGGARVYGQVRSQRPREACLTFDFDSDQSFLTATLRDLNALATSYPKQFR